MTDLAIGLMSGTSLDGVDAALVRFSGDRPEAELVAFRAAPYEATFRRRVLHTIEHGGVRDVALLDAELGRRFAAAAREVLDASGTPRASLAFVASHGQTVWHEPGKATLQLGNPAAIAETLSVPVVCDFRSRLVALMEQRGAEQALKGLQQWICEAEQSGIRALQDFARRLKGYTLATA